MCIADSTYCTVFKKKLTWLLSFSKILLIIFLLWWLPIKLIIGIVKYMFKTVKSQGLIISNMVTILALKYFYLDKLRERETTMHTFTLTTSLLKNHLGYCLFKNRSYSPLLAKPSKHVNRVKFELETGENCRFWETDKTSDY